MNLNHLDQTVFAPFKNVMMERMGYLDTTLRHQDLQRRGVHHSLTGKKHTHKMHQIRTSGFSGVAPDMFSPAVLWVRFHEKKTGRVRGGQNCENKQ